MFNSDPEDQEVDVTDLESPDDENEKNKPLEETFIVKQNVEKAAEKASTERSASQTWFKCGKTGPKCHKRFIHSDLEKHNQQYHSQEKEVESAPKSTEEEMKEKAVEKDALDEDSTTKTVEKDNKEERVEKEARVVPAAATTDEEFSEQSSSEDEAELEIDEKKQELPTRELAEKIFNTDTDDESSQDNDSGSDDSTEK